MTPARAPALLLLAIAAAAGCSTTERAPATTTSAATTVPVATLGAHREVSAGATLARSHVITERRTLQVDHCVFEARLPRIESGNAASDARIAATLETALAGWAGMTSQSGCRQDEAQGEVAYAVDLDAHGIVAISLTYPLTPMDRFSIPSSHAFVLATGEELTAETLYRADRARSLEALLAKEYDRAYHHRADCETNGYGTSRGSFVFTKNGLAFDDWSNIPMHARNCGTTVVTLPYRVAASYLRADVAALLDGP